MAYSFTAVWCKGSSNTVLDALSRHPVLEPSPGDASAEQEEDYSSVEIKAWQANGHPESVRLQDLRRHAALDEEYQHLKAIILRGFPNHKGELQESCKQYRKVRHNVTIDENLIVYGCHLLVPRQMRREILKQLHEAHQGMVCTKQRARFTIYWPMI